MCYGVMRAPACRSCCAILPFSPFLRERTNYRHDLLILLSEYFEEMSKIISTSGGTLLEFIGDAILACWNAPQDIQDHTVMALLAALKMNARLKELHIRWDELEYPDIQIRVGVHRATVFVGTFTFIATSQNRRLVGFNGTNPKKCALQTRKPWLKSTDEIWNPWRWR